MFLHLIRHGQASFGSRNYDVLSPLGHEQAAILGRHAQTLGWQLEAIIHGSLSRQIDTAQPLAPLCATASHTHTAFNEYPADAIIRAYLPGVLSAHPNLADNLPALLQDKKQFQAVFELIIARWLAGEPGDTKGFESWHDFRNRVCHGLETAVEQHAGAKRIAIVSSGGPIAVACQKVLNLTDVDTFKLNWQIANTSVTTVRYGKSGWQLTGFNQLSHLELLQRDGLITWR